MIQKMLLKNREYQVNGSWYAPRERLQQYPSVTRVELIDTTSSAGDWWGLFVQKLQGRFYVIPFFQSSNWRAGFTFGTGEVVASGVSDFSQDDLYDIANMMLETMC